MGTMFGNLKSTDNLEQAEDRVGGGYEPIESAIYDATIKLAYLGSARNSNARNVTIHADINGKEFRETTYFTKKTGENFYEKDGKQHPLPGFTTVEDLCLFITGQGLIEQEDAGSIEERVVKLYDYEKKAEVNTPVQCLVALHDQPIKLAILREIVDKQTKQGDVYVNTGETRMQNVIDKVLHPETSRTVNEYRQEIEEAEFAKAWAAKNEGNDRNKATGVQNGGGAGAQGSGKPNFGGASNGNAGGQGSGKPLFGKKAG